MEALESVTQGINRLLEFEYKKVHELKFPLYEVDKKRREKRVEVGPTILPIHEWPPKILSTTV